MVWHVLRIALLQAAKGPPAEERGEHFLLIVGQSVALGFHHACCQRFVNSFWRHLAHRVGRRRLRDGRISMAAHTMRLKSADARFRAGSEIRASRSRSLLRRGWRLRLGRPTPCQERAQECECNDVRVSFHWSDSFWLDCLVFAALPHTKQPFVPWGSVSDRSGICCLRSRPTCCCSRPRRNSNDTAILIPPSQSAESCHLRS